MRLPRLQSAVPQTWPVRMEIARAVQTLAKEVQEAGVVKHSETSAKGSNCDLVAEVLSIFREELRKAGFRTDQPRWPKRSGIRSGRWSGGAGSLEVEERERRKKGGHHYVPREIFDKLFRKMKLKPETWQVFNHAVTGPLAPDTHRYDTDHRAYTKAVSAMWDRFLENSGISSEDVTPEQAHSFIERVLRSNDHRIRDYNARLWR